MSNELRILKQPSSIAIADTVLSLPNQHIIDKEALKIILFATEEGLGCKDTATAISLTIEESDDINRDMFLIIRDLTGNIYFYSTPEISGLIETYFEKVGSKFNDLNADELILDSGNLQQSVQTPVDRTKNVGNFWG